MSGNMISGKKAAATNRRKYGADFYAKIGALGGKKGTTGGFYANRELARIAGKKGGLISRKKQRFIGFDEFGVPQWMREPKRNERSA